jgi:hypothetical protein
VDELLKLVVTSPSAALALAAFVFAVIGVATFLFLRAIWQRQQQMVTKEDLAELIEAVKGGPDDWALGEMRRQLKAAWDVIEVLRLQIRNLELGAEGAKAELNGYLKAQEHRIDVHATRSDQQQTQNAEFFAKDARAALKRVEDLAARIARNQSEDTGE